MSIEEKIAFLRERDTEGVARKTEELDRIYKAAPATIKQVSELMGIEPELLIKSCNDAGWHSQTPWYIVLDMLRSFWLAKNRREQEQASGEQNRPHAS